MTTNQLIAEIHRKKSFLCVGLDVDLDKIPKHLLALEDPIFEFNKAIIDATRHVAVAYKPNIAFFEAYGLKGWKALEKTINYLNEKSLKFLLSPMLKEVILGTRVPCMPRHFLKTSISIPSRWHPIWGRIRWSRF